MLIYTLSGHTYKYYCITRREWIKTIETTTTMLTTESVSNEFKNDAVDCSIHFKKKPLLFACMIASDTWDVKGLFD